jgi:hypothetical protein
MGCVQSLLLLQPAVRMDKILSDWVSAQEAAGSNEEPTDRQRGWASACRWAHSLALLRVPPAAKQGAK